MSNIQEASALHKQAATDHEAAAKHHRKAADCHDQNKHSDAKGSSKSAMDCCNTAQKTSATACGCSAKYRRAHPSIHKAVGKVLLRFPDSAIHQEVAKTVAVLQILGNMPVTAQNVAALMHPAIDAPTRRDQVDTAIKELISDALVPFGEKDGNLCFFSEKINDIDQERAQIPLRSIETRRIQNEALREAFSPLPSVRLQGTFTVTSGLKAQTGANVSSLAGERETIQTVVELVDPEAYEAARTRLVDDSREHSARNTIFLLARTAPEIEDRLAEIYRCREIAQRHRNDPDQEVKEYCTCPGRPCGQADW